MIKIFYRNLDRHKVFFDSKMKLRTYAYGETVHNSFVEWRREFLRRYNSSNNNMLCFESGDLGGNLAKLDCAGQIMICEADDATRKTKPKYGLQPLWIGDALLEVNEGVVFINGKETDTNIGTDLKGWAICPIWKNKIAQYSLFVIGKPRGGKEVALAVYTLDKNGVGQAPIITRYLEESAMKSSKIYCFERHIFIMHNSRINYFYYTPEQRLLEEVGIECDSHNDEKECCGGVPLYSDVVVNSHGRVFWLSNNTVYTFSIGYPQAITRICAEDFSTVVRIQCYGEYLFVYCKNDLNDSLSCKKYTVSEKGELDGEEFNTGSANNVFFSEKEGALYYVKVCAFSRKLYIAKSAYGSEIILEQLRIPYTEELFCLDGKLYTDARYVGYDGERNAIAIKR
jgi:hypothetical protein